MRAAISSRGTRVNVCTRHAITDETTVANTVVFARSCHVASGVAAAATMVGVATVDGEAGLAITSETLGGVACTDARARASFGTVCIWIAHAVLRQARITFNALEPITVVTTFTEALAGASTSRFANTSNLVTATVIGSTSINCFARCPITLVARVARASNLTSI